jgi:hypothetical protein
MSAARVAIAVGLFSIAACRSASTTVTDGGMDAGALDSGVDGGWVDAGSMDAGPPDSGVDAGQVDAGITVPGTFFGMLMNHAVVGVPPLTPWPSVAFGSVRLWDTGCAWTALNPHRGVYDWSTLDPWLAWAPEHGVDLLYTFGQTPPWAIPSNIPIVSITRAADIVTVVTGSAHGLYFIGSHSATTQSEVMISGVSDPTFNGGPFLITSTPNQTQLTYLQDAGDASGDGGVVDAVCGGPYAPRGCAEAPINTQDWHDFVAALAAHVDGGIENWELWNEANLDEFWRGDMARLVTLSADARSVIKAVDPNATVVSPSVTVIFETQSLCDSYDPRCGTKWMSGWLGLGGWSLIDAVAFHAYPPPATPNPPTEAPEHVIGQIAMQRAVMVKNDAGQLPLWDTESSWALDSHLTDPQQQAAWVARHRLLEWSNGVERAYWYSWDNTTYGTLWSSDGGILAAGVSYGEIEQWMTGAVLTSPCADAGSVWTCGQQTANGPTLAVWDTAGSSRFSVPQGFTRYRQLDGGTVFVDGGTVTLSPTPILLE